MKSIWLVHVTKTAGTAIRKSLEGVLLPENLPDQQMHLTAREWQALLGAERWNELRSFAVIRDPFDRLASAWLEMCKSDTVASLLKDCYGDFPNWVERITEDTTVLDSRMPKSAIQHQRTQSDYVTDLSGKIITTRLLLFEDVARQFKQLCEDWHISARPLQQSYVTGEAHARKFGCPKPFKDLYTARMRQLVYKAYADDFKIHGALKERK